MIKKIREVILKYLGDNEKTLKKLKKIYRYFNSQFKKGSLRRYFHFLIKGHLLRRLIIRRYFSEKNVDILQVGGGYHIVEKWLNGDIIAGDIYLNATKRFPFADSTFKGVFAEQFIEHINYETGKYFLEESYRILKPDGVIRLATPNLYNLCLCYSNIKSEFDIQDFVERHRQLHNPGVTTPAHFLNDIFRFWGHKFIYDEETLSSLLIEAGFKEVKKCDYGKSDFIHFKNRERHITKRWDFIKDELNLIIEGRKLK